MMRVKEGRYRSMYIEDFLDADVANFFTAHNLTIRFFHVEVDTAHRQYRAGSSESAIFVVIMPDVRLCSINILSND
jgi:hypothetical protein